MTTPKLGPSHPDFGKPSIPTGAATQVTLPSSPEIRRWVERTQQEREALRARAEGLRAKFEPLRLQLAGIERSIKVLEHFLAQVSVEGETAGAPSSGLGAVRRRPGGRLLTGQWSRKHVACVACGTPDKPHKAQGYCKDCYERRDRVAAAQTMDGAS